MADDVLTRNSADELALRVAQSSGDTGTNKDDVYTRDSLGRLAVRTVGSGGGGGGADYSAEIRALENAVSVLATSVNLTTEIGGKTTVALGDLTAMDIDGRPSYKQAGATVFADNGVVGIIDSVDSTSAFITTVQHQAEQQGGSSEIVWDKTKTVYIDYTGENLGWAYAQLNLGVLSDGKYSFYIATKAITESGRIASGEYEDGALFVDSIMKVEFVVDGDKYIKGYCYAIPPFVGTHNIGPNIFGPHSLANGRPKLYRTPEGETIFYFDSPGMMASDVPLYLSESGSFDLWKVSKLVKDDGIESSMEFSNFYYESQGNPTYYYPYYELGYMPLVRIFENPVPYTSSYFSSSVFDGDEQQFIEISGVIPDEVGLYDSNMGGNGFVGNRRIYMINKNTRDVCMLEVCINPSYIKAQVVYCTGVFDVDWKLAIREDEYSQFSVAWVYADGLRFNDCIVANCFYGNNGNVSSEMGFRSGLLEEGVKIVSFDRFKKPTSTSSEYLLYHENGLVEMGGIVSINETLQPDVALGNVPVVFQNELANANFVPTITVMTDGTFKQVMADVANPTATGFDLCVRNVDAEAVSGIKIAWKVVGTKK